MLLVCSAAAPASVARAQDADPEAKGQWFLGGYYRHNWIPSYMLAPFLTRAPSITNDGFGLLVSHRSAGGLTAQVGLGYMPYFVHGAFTAKDTLVEDTEYIRSDLALLHLTGALLWPIEFNRMLALEFGFGLDFGIFTGNLTRNEAYPDATGNFHACQAAHMPVVLGPDKRSDGTAIEYCDQAFDRNGKPIATNTASQKGEQYGVRDNRVPPVMAFPMLPLLALRFSPHEQIAIKFEFSYGIAQIWLGASVHVGFGHSKPKSEAIEPDVAREPKEKPEALEPVVRAQGRVLGKVLDQNTEQPVAQAVVKTSRALSALQTDDRGLFIVDRISGVIRFEVSHPDYESGTCQATIPRTGGDIPLHCFLVPKPTEGAISGQVNDEKGSAVAGARVEMLGPKSKTVNTDHDGLFALPDAPAGSYRVRVDAEGYLMQLVEVEVAPRDTTLPKIILIKKPTTSLVRVEAKEIYIKQQINFATNSAEIGTSSDPLMREIADVLLRDEGIRQLEIQGHTDNKGGREHNQQLSQARAESVRAWLVLAGVAPARLVAKGYGQDMPLRPNSTAADRAKNRRVQFIIVSSGEALTP
ncbi:MAG TPA: OmpA family protein [Polyangiales bacterium]